VCFGSDAKSCTACKGDGALLPGTTECVENCPTSMKKEANKCVETDTTSLCFTFDDKTWTTDV
jgi:hypothetical protein